MRNRLGALVGAVFAVLVMLGSPALAAASRSLTGPVWTRTLHDGPWGLTADARGAIVTTDTSDVLALDHAGRVRWQTHVDSLVEGPPALDRRLVLIGGRGLVTVVSRDTGARRWEQRMAASVTSMSLAGELALVGDHVGTLSAFDARTGAPRWSAHFDGRLWSAPRVDLTTGSVVATWHGSTAPAVRVLDLTTGALRWEAPTGSSTAAPLVTNGLVLVAAGDGKFHAGVEAHDLASGAPRWETPLPASFEEAIEPSARGNDFVVVDHFGVVSMLHVATGAIRWQHDVGHALLETRMSLTARRVVLTSFSGDVFVLDRASGHVVASASAEHLGGYPIATATTSWGRRSGLLVALRMAEPFRVELHPLP